MKNRSRRRSRRQAGFTLLETVIASGILTLMLAGATAGFVFCLAAVSRANVQADRRRAVTHTATRFQSEVEKATSASVESWGRRLVLKGEIPGSKKKKTKTTATFYTSYRSGGYNLYVKPRVGQKELLASGLAYPYHLFSQSGTRLRMWLWLRDEEGYYLVQTGSLLDGPIDAEEDALASR